VPPAAGPITSRQEPDPVGRVGGIIAPNPPGRAGCRRRGEPVPNGCAACGGGQAPLP
jgi:hypothetical protein